MATTIQLLRSDLTQTRPEPNVLANGTPMVNLHESEPGLFFTARDGSLVKIGPTALGPVAPNFFPQGIPGNTIGELWVDTSGAVPDLKIFDGSDFISASGVLEAVSSVGLEFDSVFSVSGSPVTSTGTFSASLLPQEPNKIFAGPVTGADSAPTFRNLVSDDIPALPASKITSGTLNADRIPSLNATKIGSGTFSPDRIPDLPATKITFGVLAAAVGGTGTSAIPTNGQLLVGTGTGWNVASLNAGSNVVVTPGLGSLQVSVSDTPAFNSVALKDGTGDTLTLAAPNVTIPYVLNLPAADGTSGAVLTTNGGGQLSFSTSLINISSVSGLSSVVGLGQLSIFSGGVNQNIVLEPSGTGLVQIGDAANSPAFRDNLTTLDVRLADGSDYTQLHAAALCVAKAYAVSSLPSPAIVGQIARVIDANSPAIGSTAVGSGAAPALCWYNGSNWTVIGI